MAKKLILEGKYEVVDVSNPTTFIFEKRHYSFDLLTEKDAKHLIVNGFPYLKKIAQEKPLSTDLENKKEDVLQK